MPDPSDAREPRLSAEDAEKWAREPGLTAASWRQCRPEMLASIGVLEADIVRLEIRAAHLDSYAANLRLGLRPVWVDCKAYERAAEAAIDDAVSFYRSGFHPDPKSVAAAIQIVLENINPTRSVGNETQDPDPIP